jgi:methyl-galactoside transport system substrate-binding protein
MKKFLSILAVVALMFTLTACGGTEDDGKITIGVNIYDYNDNFMNSVVKPAIEEYVGTMDDVEIKMVDSQADQGKLNNQIDTWIDSGIDVLMINLVDPAAGQTVIDKAKAADIPLVLFNKETTKEAMASYDKVWYVGTNSAESGIVQGQLILDDVNSGYIADRNGNGVIDYIMLQGEAGHPDAIARTVESVKVLTDAGKSVEELGFQVANWATDQAKNAVDTFLDENYANIDVIIANNDGMALGVIQSLQTHTNGWGADAPADGDIRIYGVDAIQSAVDAIEAGTLGGTVLNDGENQGKAALDLAIAAAKGELTKDSTMVGNWKIESDGTKAVRVPYVKVGR